MRFCRSTPFSIVYSLCITLFFCAVVSLVKVSSGLAVAEDVVGLDSEQQIIIDADEAFLERAVGDTIADGHVTVKFGEYFVSANKVLYNRKEDILIAKDKVLVHDKKYGNFYYVDYVKIHPKTRGIELHVFKSSLADGKILATASNVVGKRRGGYSADCITFSACKVCADNFEPNKPLWQMRAAHVDVDLDKGAVHYHDVYLDIWGRPVLYLPYFVTPSFNTKFRSGFLFPSMYMGSQSYGFAVATPYYINFSPVSDLTITPYFSTARPLIISLEHRRVFKNGGYVLSGSVTKAHLQNDIEYGRRVGSAEKSNTKTGDEVYRGYVAGNGNWNLLKDSVQNKYAYQSRMSAGTYDTIGMSGKRDVFETGFDTLILVDKDKTYLKRYNYNNDDILLSKFYLNSASNRYSSSASIDVIQDLRDNAYRAKIISLPRLQFMYLVPQRVFGADDALFKVYGNAYELFDDQGGEYKSADLWVGGYFPMVFTSGHVIELRPHMRMLGFTQSKNMVTRQQKEKSFAGVVPEAVITWRFPFTALSHGGLKRIMTNDERDDVTYGHHDSDIRASHNILHKTWLVFVEPIINLRLAPYQYLNQSRFSQEFLLPSAYDILQSDRMSQLFDQGHSGSSLQYGVKASVFVSGKNQLDFAIANSQRFYSPHVLNKEPGMSIYQDSRTSGLMLFNALRSSNLSIENNMWFSNKRNNIVRDVFSVNWKEKKLQAAVGYMFMDYKYYSVHTLDYKNEIFMNVWYNIYQKWWLNADIRRKIGKNAVGKKNNMSAKIWQGAGIRYKNECLQVDLLVYKNYLKLRDLRPSTNYLLRFGLPF